MVARWSIGTGMASTLRLPAGLHEQLRKHAYETRTPASQIVVRALTAYLSGAQHECAGDRLARLLREQGYRLAPPDHR
jgi:hypothetical protein